MNITGLLRKFFIWRVRHIPPRQFLLVMSFVVGIFSGVAAVLLKTTIYYTRNFLTRGFDIESSSFWYLVFPFLGIILTALFVKFVVRDNISHGVSRILFAISKKGSIIKLVRLLKINGITKCLRNN